MKPASDSSAESRLARLFDELCTQLQAGHSVDLEAYRRQHPEQAAELDELMPAVQLLLDLRAAEDVESVPGAESRPRAERASSVLGDFRLISEIGRGGMGVVFEAEQISLGRRVALKVLPFASVLHPSQQQRFQNEVRIAATLDHPNIVRVYAVGCDRGVHHFAMQFVDGQSLAEAIRQLRQRDTSWHRRKDTSLAGEANEETPRGLARRWKPAIVRPCGRPARHEPYRLGRCLHGRTGPRQRVLSQRRAGGDPGGRSTAACARQRHHPPRRETIQPDDRRDGACLCDGLWAGASRAKQT